MKQEMQVLISHQSNEWYTPPEVIDLVRAVLGQIDLDPASAPYPQHYIGAGTFWTKNDDGLSKEWFGRVFCNPPYGKTGGKSNQDVWAQKLTAEYEKGNVTEALLLVNTTHGYSWYENIYTKRPVCFVRRRMSFLNENGLTVGQAKRGQTIVYFGKNIEKFRIIFSKAGRVLLPEE